MKKFIYLFLIVTAISSAAYSQANTALSNLTTTAINQDLLPNANNTRSLGSAGKSWQIIYLDSALYLRDTLFMHNRGTQNSFAGSRAGFSITSGGYNSGFGYHSLYLNTTGSSNSAVGYRTLSFNSSGAGNTAVGATALYKNTTASNNTATGYVALYSNTTGYDNTATGSGAMYNNSTGFFNAAYGFEALNKNTTGNSNTALGEGSMAFNSTGNYNTATGERALYTNANGSNNTANGGYSLYANSSGNYNTGVGAFSFRYNNVGSNNTGIGYEVLAQNNGNDNTAAGYYAMYKNVNGYSNVAIGSGALYNTTYVHNFVAVGDSALYNQAAVFEGGEFPAPGYNTALGSKALYTNTNGQYNTATGYQALYSNATGSYNTANGNSALHNNTGANNTANGSFALSSNTNASDNTAQGAFALSNNTASNNTAVGSSALANNTTGDANTAIGEGSLSGNTTGFQNSAMGYQSLLKNTGYYNVGIGTQTLYNNTNGNANTAIGCFAGYNRDAIVACTFLGYGSDAAYNSLNNSTAVGNAAIVNANNKIRLGNGSVTVVESNAGSWTTSDGRFKTNIKQNVKGLEFINLLKPVTYNFDVKKFEGFLMQNFPDSVKAARMKQMNQSASVAKTSAIVQTGFVAQDVAEAVKKSGYNFNGVHAPENANDNWSLSYEKMVVPLVKAVQELSKMNDDKDAKIASLESRLNKIETLLKSKSASVSLNDASLEQNVPNPFSKTTTINYNLPATLSSAQIVLTDNSGKVLKTVNVSGAGKGSLNLDAATVAAGIYNYSLIVDGKLVSTKKMVAAK